MYHICSVPEDGVTLSLQDKSSICFPVPEWFQPFTQDVLNYLIWNFGLSKNVAEFLGSRLKNK